MACKAFYGHLFKKGSEILIGDNIEYSSST